MHAGLVETGAAFGNPRSKLLPYAGINRIRFNGSTPVASVSGARATPRKLRILTPFHS